jgi:hypothetical protein
MRLIQMSPPAGALVARADIEGRTLRQDKGDGEPFYAADLAPRQQAPSLSSTVPAGRLLATVRVGAMDLPVPELSAGDRVDILQARVEGVELIAADAQVMGTLRPRNPAPAGDNGRILGIDLSIPNVNQTQSTNGELALVLAVLPYDVYALTAAEASGRKMKLVLHSDQEVKSGKLINLRPMPQPAVAPGPPAPSVEVLLGGKVERVYF